jgi:hypothetical protein
MLVFSRMNRIVGRRAGTGLSVDALARTGDLIGGRTEQAQPYSGMAMFARSRTELVGG